MKIKQALDELFKDVDFDIDLYKALVKANIDLITSTSEHKNLFGSRLIGCHHLSYTDYHKNLFYESVFGLELEAVLEAIDKITTIPKNFEIARDDINLTLFYGVHRFLSNPELKKEKAQEYAREALNYFNYRTLIVISAKWFKYPISEEKAVSLSERLSNRYIIKRVRNWNEYCQYRSSEYLTKDLVQVVSKFNQDDKLPNAINDLYNRTKNMMHHIYGEFTAMLEEQDILKSRKNVVVDPEGNEVVVDRTDSPTLYIGKVEHAILDKNNFIKRDLIDVTSEIVNSVSTKQLEESLLMLHEYYFRGKEPAEHVRSFIQSFLVSCFDYLHRNEVRFSSGHNVLKVVNLIAGNVLYARGTDIEITQVKEQAEKLVKDAYKQAKQNISGRNLKNARNALCIYLLLIALM